MSDRFDDVLTLLSSRRSVRSFGPEAPPRALIERLLSAAVTAPSASNKQPWRFVVVTSRARIVAMADAVRAACDTVRLAIAAPSRPSFEAYGAYFTRFEAAPVVIAVLHRPIGILSHLVDDSVDPAVVARLEAESGLIGAAMALQNLLLAAPSLGLGASGMTGPLLARPALRELLRVRPSWSIAALAPVGFPAEEPPPTRRKDAGRVTRWIED